MIKKKIIKTISLFTAILTISTITPIINQSYATEKINNVNETLNSLTLYEKICQMFIVYQYKMPNITTGESITHTEIGNALKESLKKYPVGGILYDAGSIQSHNQLTNLLSTANSYSKIPLIFSIDEEGGRVARIGRTIGYTRGPILNAMGTYSNQGTKTAYDNALYIGQNIADHGFNLDFAPVADTFSNSANTVIGDRAYSTDFDETATLIGSAVQGFHSAGVGTTLKHFPGHGDTSGDTHAGSVYVYKTLREIRVNELKAFRAGIKNGTDAIMLAHIIVKEAEGPTLFSKKMVTNILKEEMGFEGLIITDGLGMGAMLDVYSSDQIVLKGINAGVDIFLCIDDLPLAIKTIENAVLDGTISEERINESVRKILEFKLKYQN